MDYLGAATSAANSRGIADELRRSAAGRVLTPVDPDWLKALQGQNTALRHDPLVVLEASDAADLRAGVALASQHGLAVAVQATGHGPTALLRGGILIKTDRLTDVRFDADTRSVRVEAGVTWGALVAAVAPHGFAPLGMPSLAGIGVVGYTLGGGIGPFGRLQGFAADHLRSVEVVGADAMTHTLDAHRRPDWFWAICGGRLGCGVVSAVTLDLAPTAEVHASLLTYDQAQIRKALTAYAEWQRGLPDNVGAIADLSRQPDLPTVPEDMRGRWQLLVDVVQLGEAGGFVDRLTQVAPPLHRVDSTADPDRWLDGRPSPPAGGSWTRALVLDRLDANVVDRLLAAVGPESDAPWQSIALRPMGGALSRSAKRDNAVGARHDGVLINTVAGGDPQQFTTLPATHARLIEHFGDVVRPTTPINFHGVADEYLPLAGGWSAETYRRLTALWNRYDPHHQFTPASTAAGSAR